MPFLFKNSHCLPLLLFSILSPCFNFRDLHSVRSARDWLWSAFVYTAMVNYPTEANFMMPLPAYPVQEVHTTNIDTGGAYI